MGDIHEIRDPIHNFIGFDDDEKDLLKLWPIQRMRDLSQLGTCHYVYPSCTHKRFEHSLGVMELSTRIFDKVTAICNQPDNIRKSRIIPNKDYKLLRDRQILRVAALCHDIGHLPFSHSLESLLPKGVSHEHITYKLITESPIADYVNNVIKENPKRVAAISVGNNKNELINKQRISESPYSMDTWDMILSSMITSDHFGADRIDYLIRDSHHAGVAYGRFDFHRLIDCLVLVMRGGKVEIGIDEGGIHTVESLLIARYFLSALCT